MYSGSCILQLMILINISPVILKIVSIKYYWLTSIPNLNTRSSFNNIATLKRIIYVLINALIKRKRPIIKY